MTKDSNTLTLTDAQVIAIVDTLLEYECVRSVDRIERVIERRDGATSLHDLKPLVDRWLLLQFRQRDLKAYTQRELMEAQGFVVANGERRRASEEK